MPSPDVNVPSPALIVSLHVNKFPNKVAPKVLHSIPKNSDSSILSNYVFDSFILAEELFPKAIRSFETCILLSNNF